MPTTLIHNADIVVAWDAAAGSHSYLTGADLAFADGVLSFVGRGYEGATDQVVSGTVARIL